MIINMNSLKIYKLMAVAVLVLITTSSAHAMKRARSGNDPLEQLNVKTAKIQGIQVDFSYIDLSDDLFLRIINMSDYNHFKNFFAVNKRFNESTKYENYKNKVQVINIIRKQMNEFLAHQNSAAQTPAGLEHGAFLRTLYDERYQMIGELPLSLSGNAFFQATKVLLTGLKILKAFIRNSSSEWRGHVNNAVNDGLIYVIGKTHTILSNAENEEQYVRLKSSSSWQISSEMPLLEGLNFIGILFCIERDDAQKYPRNNFSLIFVYDHPYSPYCVSQKEADLIIKFYNNIKGFSGVGPESALACYDEYYKLDDEEKQILKNIMSLILPSIDISGDLRNISQQYNITPDQLTNQEIEQVNEIKVITLFASKLITGSLDFVIKNDTGVSAVVY